MNPSRYPFCAAVVLVAVRAVAVGVSHEIFDELSLPPRRSLKSTSHNNSVSDVRSNVMTCILLMSRLTSIKALSSNDS